MCNPQTMLGGVLTTYEYHDFGTYIFPYNTSGEFTTEELHKVTDDLRRMGYLVALARTSHIDLNDHYNGHVILGDG